MCRPPFAEDAGATHAFMDAKVVLSSKVNVAHLREQGVLCLKPEYISEFLARETPPSPSDFAI